MIKKRKPTKSKVASKVSTQTKVFLVVAMALAAFIGYSFALSMFGNVSKINSSHNNEIYGENLDNCCKGGNKVCCALIKYIEDGIITKRNEELGSIQQYLENGNTILGTPKEDAQEALNACCADGYKVCCVTL